MIGIKNQMGFFAPFPYGGMTWLDDWREFFNPYNIIPDAHQDIPDQFNCLTRIIVLLAIALYLFNGCDRYVLILIGFMLAITILYIVLYKKAHMKMKENFQGEARGPACRTPIGRCSYQEPIVMYDSGRPQDPIIVSPLNSNPSLIDVKQAHNWCFPDLVLGEETASANQKLTGNRANPKTEAVPVVPPPMYEPDNWAPNDFVVPWKINDQRRQELYQNGYMTWEESRHNAVGRAEPQDIRENFPSYQGIDYGQAPGKNPRHDLADVMMDTANGYYPENSRYGYPVNMPPTDNMRIPAMQEYNRNLYSIPLQPGVSTRSQVNQPDASMYNLGISYTQPHLPYHCEMDDRGNMMIDEYDPNQYPSEYLLKGRDQYGRDGIPRHEIYDPRLTGYGTSYRSYNDPMTGQPRFFYDDIDAHTQYNYITRNKIDFTDFGRQTGPYEEAIDDVDVRTMADQTFHNNVMKQRTELQYRLMAKNSHREWQQRAAPLNRNNTARAQCGLPSASSYAGPRGG